MYITLYILTPPVRCHGGRLLWLKCMTLAFLPFVHARCPAATWAVFFQSSEDTATGLHELSEAAATTLRAADATLATQAGDGAGDALRMFQGLADTTLHGGAGQGFLWGLVPVTYSQSPHKFCVIVVGLTAESVAVGRTDVKKALASAAAAAGPSNLQHDW